jgi:ferredoxin-type protein NapH
MRKRRIFQILSLLALNSSWGPQVKWLCVPVLNCHSCALSWFACPVGVFVHFSAYHVFPFLALGTILLVGVFLGRLLCGWVCPFGFLQDMLYKIPTRKFDLPGWTSHIKYPALILGVFLLPYFLTEQTWYSFCRICPAAALQVSTPNLVSEGAQALSLATIIRFSVLGVVVGFAIVSSRSFCKVLCPIGAILAPLNYLSFWAINVPAGSCKSCKKCDEVCSMDIDPSTRILQKIPPNRALDCITCHECQSACSERIADIRSDGEAPQTQQISQESL